jgi:hypothetical protein
MLQSRCDRNPAKSFSFSEKKEKQENKRNRIDEHLTELRKIKEGQLTTNFHRI